MASYDAPETIHFVAIALETGGGYGVAFQDPAVTEEAGIIVWYRTREEFTKALQLRTRARRIDRFATEAEAVRALLEHKKK